MNINLLISNLKSEYPYKADIHCHTSPVSGCSRYPVVDLVEDFHANGYSFICMTNHFDPNYVNSTPKEASDYYLSDYRLAKQTGEKLGLPVLLGMELRVTENSNDYLIYGICEEDVARIRPYLEKPEAEFYRDFKTDRNLILQAHPFRNGMVFTGENIDGIEVYNVHPGHNSRVAIAAKEATDRKFVHTMGIDLHYPEHKGITAVRFSRIPKDSYELAALLKTGDYIFQIADDIILPQSYGNVR